jgi:hypothetical protein
VENVLFKGLGKTLGPISPISHIPNRRERERERERERDMKDHLGSLALKGLEKLLP